MKQETNFFWFGPAIGIHHRTQKWREPRSWLTHSNLPLSFARLMQMKALTSIAVAMLCLIGNSWGADDTPANPNEGDITASPELKGITWIKGPSKGELKDIAQLQIPPGFMMTSGKGTRQLLELMGNPTSGSELALLSPTNLSWFVLFEFSDVGYVEDKDKDKLDANAILNTIKQGTEQANKYRAERDISPLHIVGWEYPPKYNPETHNLEWAIRAESEGKPVINYNTRLLGRHGVMEANLVIDPAKLEDALPTYRTVLQNYSFQQGQNYAEYKKGDKIAKYGLAALITGGAAAVALKTGMLAWVVLLFKKAWKLVVVAFAAIVGFFKKLALGRTRQPLNEAAAPPAPASNDTNQPV
jgi:uncharacterized membrane-anchored protein